MVSADEFSRSLRGTAAFLNRRPDALGLFETTGRGFWRSFGAIVLTVPAYVVDLALVRERLGHSGPDRLLFDLPGLAAVVGAVHLTGFLLLPVAMIFVARRLGLGAGYVPFVVVTNWLAVFASFALAVPSTLYLVGLEPRPVATLFTAAFGVVALAVQWHATRATLQTGFGATTVVTLLGLAASVATWECLEALG